MKLSDRQIPALYLQRTETDIKVLLNDRTLCPEKKIYRLCGKESFQRFEIPLPFGNNQIGTLHLIPELRRNHPQRSPRRIAPGNHPTPNPQALYG